MRRRYLFLLTTAIAVVIIAGVSFAIRRQRAKPIQAARNVHQHLPPSAWEPASNLSAVYHLQDHDSLASIAGRRYGHQDYAEVIRLYNHIEDAAVVAKDTTVKLPDIANILAEEGFTRVAAPETEMIFCSRAKYERVKQQLAELRINVAPKQRVSIPANVKQELLEAADDLQQAAESLKRPRPGVSAAPTKMIDQLESAMRIIKALASGLFDGYGYDIDMVQQHYALALTNGIIWARDGFK